MHRRRSTLEQASPPAAEADTAPPPYAHGDRAFRALLALRHGPGLPDGGGIGLDVAGSPVELSADDPLCLLARHGPVVLAAEHAPAESRAVLDLYLPMLRADRRLTVAHLGQSLDGQIATALGDAYYVTGPGNLLHLHRMRALCDAVVVGAETVATDDPRLTVRLTAGSHPVRVVLDPRRRLRTDRRVFGDGAAPTLLIAAEERMQRADERHGQAEVLGIPTRDGRLALDALLAELHGRGLRSVFIEGGGATVTQFLGAGLLDRLQIAVAPLVIGNGRPGLALPGRNRIEECLRLSHRVFRMGVDVLFDCDLRSPPANDPPSPEPMRVL